ncbi:hypothetical protein A6K24_18070 [Metabacillus litoralis]|uniref:Uncharacterized protein n=2 Tax=Metabacillus TaxID=2675233 RepID=A0A179T1Q0_9BACI|nr:hypothetical protein A6K24_18070 [Metabacillus litoralis]
MLSGVGLGDRSFIDAAFLGLVKAREEKIPPTLPNEAAKPEPAGATLKLKTLMLHFWRFPVTRMSAYFHFMSGFSSSYDDEGIEINWFPSKG